MQKFSVSFCDPIEPEMIAWGDMAPDAILDHFEKIDWKAYLKKSMEAKLDEIYFNPSFEVLHLESNNGLCIAAVGVPDNYAFSITYNRPKKAKSFLGRMDKVTENDSTGKEGQSAADAIDCLKAFLSAETVFLARKGF